MTRTYPYYSLIEHPRYRYRLDEPFTHRLHYGEPLEGRRAVIRSDDRIWVALAGDGELWIADGYAWDGASGPAVNTTSFVRGSLVHDVLYQLIAAGALPKQPWKAHADAELYRICRQDGMGLARAWWVWSAVRVFGGARDRFRPGGL